MIGRLAATVALLLVASSCSSGAGVGTVDGAEFTTEQFEALHGEVGDLDEDERAGSMLLLILDQAFISAAASDLGVELDEAAIESAYAERIARLPVVDGSPSLGNRTEDRLLIEARLDVIRDQVAEKLVRTQARGFDMDAAFEQYLLANSEVCIKQIELASGGDFEAVVQRLNSGEPFAEVARDASIDPFVGRDDGVGAGGDLGCSAPNALPPGLDVATIEAPLDRPTGPITTDVGLYLVIVYDRTVPELDDVRTEVLDLAVELQGPELFRRWAVDVLQTIEVDLDDSYGVWGILPETDPVPTVVPPSRTGDIVE